MNRREFLGAIATAPIAVRGRHALASRTFEIVTKLELDESHDAAVAWIPLALARTSPFQIDRGHTVNGNADKTRVARLSAADGSMLVADWGHMMPPPAVTVTMRVETMNYSVSLKSPNGARRTPDLGAYLKPTT